MDHGSLPIPPGGLDLETTLESGQTFLWRRLEGDTYGDVSAPDGTWYATTVEGTPVHVRRVGDRLAWRAPSSVDPDIEETIRTRLGLDHDLESILGTAPDDPIVQRALDHAAGLRLVSEPFFPTLISFICSAQMRVERIFAMIDSLRRAYGRPTTLAGRTHYTFPSANGLAAATEAELREHKLGYRAPYVERTAEQVASGELTRADIDGLPYEEARDSLTEFHGVGEKVADCVLLFALGYRQAVPLDTWIRSAIESAFPECSRDSYASTSAAIRERFGGLGAGYTQTYVFHYLRTTESEPPTAGQAEP